jgi:hypothetical protein
MEYISVLPESDNEWNKFMLSEARKERQKTRPFQVDKQQTESENIHNIQDSKPNNTNHYPSK